MKTTTTTTTTTTITQPHFHLLALTVPSVNSNKTGFKSAVVSSVYLEKFSIQSDDFLNRMHALDLRNFKVVVIDDSLEKVETRKIGKNFGSTNCIVSFIMINSEKFFSFTSFEHFFSINKEKNFETFFAIKDKS
jgi:hypothetical protein